MGPEMPRLVLFDIDGTLVSSKGGIGRQAISRVMGEIHGAPVEVTPEECAGRPDPQIVRNVLRRLGYTEERASALLPRAMGLYLDRLEATYSIRAGAYCYPGVQDLLAFLASESGVVLGLLTGNHERGAGIKLRPFGLDRYFPFGAFGSDHEERPRLPAIAVARAKERTGIGFHGKDIVIVGDTVHDVSCGRHLGVTAVAVTTGPASRDELQAEGADLVVDSLAPTEALLEVILGRELSARTGRSSPSSPPA